MEKSLDKQIINRMKTEAEEMKLTLSEYMIFQIMHEVTELSARVGAIQRQLDTTCTDN